MQSLKVWPASYCHPTRVLVMLAFALLGCPLARAVDYSLTGFGTVGYAVSDQNAPYLRYIDKGGTLKADSLIGVQGEARFDPQWSATLQVVGGAPRTRDDGVEAQVRWAFVSYRPSNEWLFRVGRLRVPFLINTQNGEVGVTYHQARLPTEVYSVSPFYDADGAAFTRTWALENSEVALDGYFGKSRIKFRNPFHADPALRLFPDLYVPEKVNVTGLILSHSSGPLVLRAGVHFADIRTTGTQKFADTFVATPIAAPPPFGGTLYVPGKIVPKLDINVLAFGADWQSGDWRLTSEYGQRFSKDTAIGIGSKSASVTIERAVGKWTPYFTYARLVSAPETRKLYQDVSSTPVPLGAQGPPLFLPASFHRILAGQIYIYDQYSTMFGTSYSLSPTSKLKLEWMRTHVGQGSVLVDGDFRHKSFNVFSMSYNFAF